MKKFDAIIIGSGQGGTPLAKKLAGAGYKTALVERRWVGGTCVNDGCTPTKAMVASAKVLSRVKKSSEFGIHVEKYHTDIQKIIARQQGIVSSFRSGSEKKLLSTDHLELIYGEASFTDHKRLRIKSSNNGTQEFTSDLIFIDTGTSPAIPDIDGIEAIPYLTSSSILELTELPDHLLIVGGGYVAMEFAQMYRRFGSNVTMIVRSERILEREDEDIAQEVSNIFHDENIGVKVNAETLKFTKRSDKITAVIKLKNKEETISCSHVLIATGRQPNTATLNLSSTRVDTDQRGFIKVDNQLATNVKGIYALGDVNGGPAFTHISYHDHLIVFNNLVHGKDQTTNGRLVPYCMYIDPQLGRVGVTEGEARSKGMNIQIAKLPMAHVARGIETGETRGLMKAIIDKDSKKILGAAILGAEGGEVMSMIEVAMMCGLSYDVLRDGIFAHPTFAESLNNLFATLKD